MPDEKSQSLNEMVAELQAIRKLLTPKGNEIQLLGSAVLNSSNTSLYLNPDYYYSIILWINSPPSSGNVNVYVNPVAEQDSANSVILLNATQDKVKIRNVKLNLLSVSTSGAGPIGTSSVFVYFVAYKNSEGDPEVF